MLGDLGCGERAWSVGGFVEDDPEAVLVVVGQALFDESGEVEEPFVQCPGDHGAAGVVGDDDESSLVGFLVVAGAAPVGWGGEPGEQ